MQLDASYAGTYSALDGRKHERRWDAPFVLAQWVGSLLMMSKHVSIEKERALVVERSMRTGFHGSADAHTRLAKALDPACCRSSRSDANCMCEMSGVPALLPP